MPQTHHFVSSTLLAGGERARRSAKTDWRSGASATGYKDKDKNDNCYPQLVMTVSVTAAVM